MGYLSDLRAAETAATKYKTTNFVWFKYKAPRGVKVPFPKGRKEALRTGDRFGALEIERGVHKDKMRIVFERLGLDDITYLSLEAGDKLLDRSRKIKTPTKLNVETEAELEPKPEPAPKPNISDQITKRTAPVTIPPLTTGERAVLLSIITNNFYNGGTDAIWSNSINDSKYPSRVQAGSLPGVVRSLVRKHLLTASGGRRADATVQFTQRGLGVAEAVLAEHETALENAPKPKPKQADVHELRQVELRRADLEAAIKEDATFNQVETLRELLRKAQRDAGQTPEPGERQFGPPGLRWSERKEVQAPAERVEEKMPAAAQVTDVQVGVPWADVADDRRAKMLYMQGLWRWYNRTKFDGKLREPTIRFLKEQAAGRMRYRAHWTASKRTIAVSPRIFNNRAAFHEIFLHEMCHQAVSEITKLTYREAEQGHGPVWKDWMRRVGLDPNRYDHRRGVDYLSEDEQRDHLIQEQRKQTMTSGELLLGHAIRADKPAKWFDAKTNRWIVGLVAGPNDKAGKRWAFVREGLPGVPITNRWDVVPPSMFYVIKDPEQHERYRTAEWLAAASKVRAYLESKRDQRRENKRSRDLLKSWFS